MIGHNPALRMSLPLCKLDRPSWDLLSRLCILSLNTACGRVTVFTGSAALGAVMSWADWYRLIFLPETRLWDSCYSRRLCLASPVLEFLFSHLLRKLLSLLASSFCSILNLPERFIIAGTQRQNMNSVSVHSHPLGKENPLGMSSEKCFLDISHSFCTYLKKINSKDIPQFENKLDFCQ